MSRATLEKWGLAFFFLLGTTILLKAYSLYVPYGVRFLYTPSIPKGLYSSKTYDRTPLARGQGVCFHTPQVGWLLERGALTPGEIVCKLVLGLPGDTVEPRGNEVFICHEGQCASAGQLQTVDTQGRPVFPAFTQETTIPPGKYYLGSTYHPRSLDSRYFGLVDAENVTVRITPVWNY